MASVKSPTQTHVLPKTVNTITASGEDPNTIGKQLSATENAPAKWQHKRKRTSQNERLETCIQTLLQKMTVLNSSQQQEATTLLQEFSLEIPKPVSKQRLKAIYQFEEKLSAWGLLDPHTEKETESPALKESHTEPKVKPKTVQKDKVTEKSVISNIIEKARQIETKLQFCKDNKIEIQAAEYYQKLQARTHICLQLPQGPNKIEALQELLKETYICEDKIIEEREAQIAAVKANTLWKKISKKWFHFKMKLLILLLLPEKEWKRAAENIHTSVEAKKYGEAGTKMLKETANHLEKAIEKNSISNGNPTHQDTNQSAF